MADPIASRSSSDPSNSCIDDDGSEVSSPVAPAPRAALSESPNQCSTATDGSASTPNGTQVLVQKFSSSPLAKQVVSSPSPSSASSSSGIFFVTTSGAVPGGGSYRVSGSVLDKHIESGPLKGTGVEVGTASVQYGKDSDVQLVGKRSTLKLSSGSGYGLSVTDEVGVVRANLGEHNDDGSLGGNIGSGVELVGREVTIDTPVGSLTGGLSISMSLSGSMGVRDADHDGKPEFCAKFSVPAYTLGACIERPW